MSFRLQRPACVIGVLLILPVALRAQGHFPASTDLNVMLRYLVEDKATPGIVLGIIDADGSTRILTAGTAGPGTPPLGPRTVFEIGSINKTFTGTLLADMVARKEVSLSDPISKYLPKGVTAPSRSGREITLLDLATHRSGLPRMVDNHTPADPKNPYADYTLDTIYAFLSSHQLRRDPGAEAEYSNLGVGLLGHLLARAAGTSYRQLLQTRILEPLGMTMTGYALEGEVAKWMAKGHVKGEVVPFWFGSEARDGAGGLRSNVEDMLKYLKAQMGAPRTALERAMREAHVERSQVSPTLAMGLGWQLVKFEGRTLPNHDGGTGGFTTHIGFDPEKRVGFVMLTNTMSFPDNIGMDFLRRGLPLSFPEANVSRDTLSLYVGTYELTPGQNMTIALDTESALTMQVGGNVRSRLYAESQSKFFTKRRPWRLTFTRDPSGTVSGVVADLGGSERVGRKIG